LDRPRPTDKNYLSALIKSKKGEREMKKIEVVSLDEAYRWKKEGEESFEKAEYDLDALKKATEAQKKAAEKWRLSEKTKRTIRPSKREEMSPSDFLIPSQKKYPVKIGGKYSKKLLMAAFRRAISQNRRDIANKAARIMKREFGKEIGKEKKED
jgi:hypothetical protein